MSGTTPRPSSASAIRNELQNNNHHHRLSIPVLTRSTSLNSLPSRNTFGVHSPSSSKGPSEENASTMNDNSSGSEQDPADFLPIQNVLAGEISMVEVRPSRTSTPLSGYIHSSYASSTNNKPPPPTNEIDIASSPSTKKAREMWKSKDAEIRKQQEKEKGKGKGKELLVDYPTVAPKALLRRNISNPLIMPRKWPDSNHQQKEPDSEAIPYTPDEIGASYFPKPPPGPPYIAYSKPALQQPPSRPYPSRQLSTPLRTPFPRLGTTLPPTEPIESREGSIHRNSWLNTDPSPPVDVLSSTISLPLPQNLHSPQQPRISSPIPTHLAIPSQRPSQPISQPASRSSTPHPSPHFPIVRPSSTPPVIPPLYPSHPTSLQPPPQHEKTRRGSLALRLPTPRPIDPLLSPGGAGGNSTSSNPTSAPLQVLNIRVPRHTTVVEISLATVDTDLDLFHELRKESGLPRLGFRLKRISSVHITPEIYIPGPIIRKLVDGVNTGQKLGKRQLTTTSRQRQVEVVDWLRANVRNGRGSGSIVGSGSSMPPRWFEVARYGAGSVLEFKESWDRLRVALAVGWALGYALAAVLCWGFWGPGGWIAGWVFGVFVLLVGVAVIALGGM